MRRGLTKYQGAKTPQPPPTPGTDVKSRPGLLPSYVTASGCKPRVNLTVGIRREAFCTNYTLYVQLIWRLKKQIVQQDDRFCKRVT